MSHGVCSVGGRGTQLMKSGVVKRCGGDVRKGAVVNVDVGSKSNKTVMNEMPYF